MKNFIYPCLTISGKIAEASDFYIHTFGEGKISQSTSLVIQIELSGQKNKTDPSQKFSPTLMFTGAKAGQASDAVHFYTQLFPNSNIQGILKYSKEDGDDPNFVKHAQFKIKDFMAMAMDSSANHGFGFNDAISLVVECETQDEIDKYWQELTAYGGNEVACGWLTDQFGVSWQIIPKGLIKLVTDPVRGQRVMNALMKMKKLVIADLESA